MGGKGGQWGQLETGGELETGGGYAAARGSVGEDFFFLQCVSGRKKEVGGCAGGRRGGGVSVVECFKNRLLTRMVGHWLGGRGAERPAPVGKLGAERCCGAFLGNFITTVTC